MVGAVERVRPKMMTVAAIMAGLLPIMWSHGTGAEVMQRIAVPMIGGMVSSTLLTLIVIPAIYAVVKGISIRRAAFGAVPAKSFRGSSDDARHDGRDGLGLNRGWAQIPLSPFRELCPAACWPTARFKNDFSPVPRTYGASGAS